MNERTTQDILAERRANIQEMRHERDAMAKKMLAAHVAELDRVLAERRASR